MRKRALKARFSGVGKSGSGPVMQFTGHHFHLNSPGAAREVAAALIDSPDRRGGQRGHGGHRARGGQRSRGAPRGGGGGQRGRGGGQQGRGGGQQGGAQNQGEQGQDGRAGGAAGEQANLAIRNNGNAQF
ncbi:MAG: hypothetical protein Q9227_002648 [Pyrenula ochraceoflavens]